MLLLWVVFVKGRWTPTFVPVEGFGRLKSGSGVVCGLDAAAEWLARLAGDEAVRLEPSPVPMLAVFGAHDALLSGDDRLATLHAHGLALAPGSSLHAPCGAAAHAAAVAGDAGAVVLAGGHDLLHGRDDTAEALAVLTLDWLRARF